MPFPHRLCFLSTSKRFAAEPNARSSDSSLYPRPDDYDEPKFSMPRDEMSTALFMKVPHDDRSGRKEREDDQEVEDLVDVEGGCFGAGCCRRLEDENGLGEKD